MKSNIRAARKRSATVETASELASPFEATEAATALAEVEVSAESIGPPQDERDEPARAARPTGLDAVLRGINPHYAFLFLLPWLIFLINPNWLFQGFGHMDPWYYFGMSLNFPRYQHIYLGYPGERLTWVLPARLFVALFSPVFGWLIFHLCVYWTSVFSLYSLIRKFAGTQAAFITAAALACHPMFLGSNGWSYVESGSIAYLLIAMVALTAAAGKRDPRFFWVLGGALWAAGAYNNLFWWILTPVAVLVYWGSLDDEPSRSLRKHVRAGLFFSLGVAITTLVLITFFYLFYGQTNRTFYHEQISMAIWGVKLKESLSGDTQLAWVKGADWIVFPVLTLFACGFSLVRHFLGVKLSRFALASVLAYIYAFSVMAYFTLKGTQLLRYDYYASILIPFEFLVLGLLVFGAKWNLGKRTLFQMVGGATALTVAPLWRVGFHTPGNEANLAWHYVAGAAAISAALVAKSRAVWVGSILGLAVASFGLTPAFTGSWVYDFNGVAATKRVAEAVRIIDAQTPQHVLPNFWIADDDPYTGEYRAIMCAFVAHGFSMKTYPAVAPGQKFAPGTEVVLLTREKGVFDQSNATLTQAGMPLRMKSQHLVSGESQTWGKPIQYWITLTEVLPQPAGQ